MSLKRKCRMRRMNDDPHEKFGAAELGRDEGVCDNQSPRALVGGRGRSGLPAHGAGAERASLSSAEERTKGNREELPGPGYGLEPHARFTTEPWLDRDAGHRKAAEAASPF